MSMIGIQIFKCTPKKNCKKCGFSTCMAFATQVASGAQALDMCPYMSENEFDYIRSEMSEEDNIIFYSSVVDEEGEYIEQYDNIEKYDMDLSDKKIIMIDVIEQHDFSLRNNNELYKRYFATDISDKVVQKLLKNYDNYLETDGIVAFYDTSLLGNTKSGIVFTTDGFYYKYFGKAVYVQYADIKRTYVLENHLELKINNSDIPEFTISDVLNMRELKVIIDELRKIDDVYGSSSLKSTGKVNTVNLSPDALTSHYEGIKQGYVKASGEYESKFRKQGDEILNQGKEFKDLLSADDQKISDKLDEYEELLSKYEEGIIEQELKKERNEYEELLDEDEYEELLRGYEELLNEYEELQTKRAMLKRNSDITLRNMEKIANESIRVADVAHNSREILDDLDKEFESQTGLKGNDIRFLFMAIGLQLARIVILNELTKIEAAGSGNRNETKLHEFQEKLLGKFNAGEDVNERPYYSSMEHIITKQGVPYDATATLTDKSIQTLLEKDRKWDFDVDSMIPTEKLQLFKGANHRFATLGHDPILGLIFGTGNIMTNTITCVKKTMITGKIGIPVLTTNHVVFTSDYKDPRIATYGSTTAMIQQVIERIKDQPSAFVASLIKQIIHIGTDLYTPCGIQIPGANLILSNTEVEKLTSYISAGDIVKIDTSAGLAELINLLISTLHTLMYDSSVPISRELYSVRTRKIITYSNVIATGSNVLWVGGNRIAGNRSTMKQLDIGGLIITVKRLISDAEYIRQIKEEFVFGGFNKMIQGNELDLEKTVWE